jgi:hypothetical protein
VFFAATNNWRRDFGVMQLSFGASEQRRARILPQARTRAIRNGPAR